MSNKNSQEFYSVLYYGSQSELIRLLHGIKWYFRMKQKLTKEATCSDWPLDLQPMIYASLCSTHPSLHELEYTMTAILFLLCSHTPTKGCLKDMATCNYYTPVDLPHAAWHQRNAKLNSTQVESSSRLCWLSGCTTTSLEIRNLIKVQLLLVDPWKGGVKLHDIMTHFKDAKVP